MCSKVGGGTLNSHCKQTYSTELMLALHLNLFLVVEQSLIVQLWFPVSKIGITVT